jgi:uncharacterized SAM-binding protein YcdF (DUF218 family)
MSYLELAFPLLLFSGLFGLLRVWRHPGEGRKPLLLAVSLVGLLLLSTNLFAYFFSLPLEIWYDKDNAKPQGDAAAIVVLAGSVSPPLPGRPYSYVGHDTYIRLQHGIWLFRNWKPVPILVCGGSFDGEAPFAAAMRRLLEAEGIPADMIWAEAQSQSTYENAIYGAEILRKHGVSRVALVVEASSMLRAAASFEKAGIAVTPAPIRFTELNWDFTDILPNWRAISLNSETVHELGGLLWYRLRGRI